MPFYPKTYEEIKDDFKTFILNYPLCILTDFSETSNLNVIASAFADALEELYVDATVGWEMTARDQIYNIFADFERKADVKASGTVIFSRFTNAPSDIVIPVGTVVGNADGIQFETTEEATIATGYTQSGSVSIQALIAGVSGNVASNTITQMITVISGVQAVTNSASTSGGLDLESDSQFQERFVNYIQSLAGGTCRKLKTEAETVTGVASAYVRPNYPSNGIITIYIDDGSGSASASLLQAVNSHLIGDGITNFGYVVCGTTLSLAAITGVTIDIEATVYINAYADWDTVKEQVNEQISEYINSLDQNEDVIWSKLIDVIHDNPDVDQVDLTTPSANVSINAGEVAKIGTITLNLGT